MLGLPPDNEPPAVIETIQLQPPHFRRLPHLLLDDLVAPGTGVGADRCRIRSQALERSLEPAANLVGASRGLSR